MRKTVRDVIGVRHRRKIALVTAITISRSIGITRGMTRDTLQSGMPACESEPCRVVIKS